MEIGESEFTKLRLQPFNRDTIIEPDNKSLQGNYYKNYILRETLHDHYAILSLLIFLIL